METYKLSELTESLYNGDLQLDVGNPDEAQKIRNRIRNKRKAKQRKAKRKKK